jgi:hypothetical protein
LAAEDEALMTKMILEKSLRVPFHSTDKMSWIENDNNPGLAGTKRQTSALPIHF